MLAATGISTVKMALAMLLLFPPLVFSMEYYVDGRNGSDTHDGSKDSPWQTIGHALSSPARWPESATNTLYILPATYNESVILLPVPLRSLHITGVALDGEMPIIDADGADGVHGVTVLDYSGTIQGLEITGAEENGINIAGNSLMATVRNCTIYGNKKGIHASDASSPLLQGNIIYANSECGIATMSYSSATISGNRIYQNGSGSPYGPSAGTCIAASSTPKIYNNIIRNNYPSGMNICDSARPIISNNVIAHHHYGDSAGTAIKVIHNIGIGSVPISNNIIYDNDHGLFSQGGKDISGNSFNSFWQNSENYFGFREGSLDIFTDPLLNADYSVSRGSPCIDSGTSSNAPTDDIAGFPRPSGAGFDRGVYEYQRNSLRSACLPFILLQLLSN